MLYKMCHVGANSILVEFGGILQERSKLQIDVPFGEQARMRVDLCDMPDVTCRYENFSSFKCSKFPEDVATRCVIIPSLQQWTLTKLLLSSGKDTK